MLTLLYYKGFSVLRTMSIEETSEMILQMCDKIGREKAKKKAFYSLQNSIQCEEHQNIGKITANNSIIEQDSESGKITNLDLIIEPKSVEKRYSEVVKKVKKVTHSIMVRKKNEQNQNLTQLFLTFLCKNDLGLFCS